MKGTSVNGAEFLIDDDMAHLLQYEWRLRESGLERRESLGDKVKCHYLHREVMGVGEDTYVYFRNGLKTDCRRENLTLTAHGFVDRSRSKSRQSKYRGVSRAGRRWRAQIRYDKQLVYIGTFRTEEEAALAYNEEARKLYGLRARLNEVGGE